jgi:hypothetical protein
VHLRRRELATKNTKNAKNRQAMNCRSTKFPTKFATKGDYAATASEDPSRLFRVMIVLAAGGG